MGNHLVVPADGCPRPLVSDGRQGTSPTTPTRGDPRRVLHRGGGTAPGLHRPSSPTNADVEDL
ncbi:unnamed protein product, partial [Amoebophrya sp. A25]|eukprot:GSA25T00025110001.1